MLPLLGRELGKLWRSLARRDRAKYSRLAAGDREQRAAERNVGTLAGDLGALRARYADLIPKKAPSAYLLFSQDKYQRVDAERRLRASGRQVTLGALAAQLGEMWSSAPCDFKAEFFARAEKSAAEHERKVQEWKGTAEFAELEQLRRGQLSRQRLRPHTEAPAAAAPAPPSPELGLLEVRAVEEVFHRGKLAPPRAPPGAKPLRRILKKRPLHPAETVPADFRRRAKSEEIPPEHDEALQPAANVAAQTPSTPPRLAGATRTPTAKRQRCGTPP